MFWGIIPLMSNGQIVPSSYRKLLAEIVGLCDGARRTLVHAHWEIGKRIVQIEQDGAARAAYGAGLLVRLSEDLTRERGVGFSPSSIKRFRQFYLLHPKGAPAHLLTWAHHAELLTVRDRKTRLLLEKRADERGMTRDELRKLIRERRGIGKGDRGEVAGGTPLVPKKGQLGLYQIRSGADVGWPRSGALVFDHGFRFYDALDDTQARGLAAGDFVEERDGKLVKVDYAKRPGYTYTAYLQEVIDGDTLWVALDAGLGGIARQKLRLRGIDCPEIDTPEGKTAKVFVETVLDGISSLTVYTSRNATHDRYEADVFFNDQDGREVFLNGLLLDTRHAVRMKR